MNNQRFVASVMRFTCHQSTKLTRGLAVLVAAAVAGHSGIGAEPSKAELIAPGSNIGKTFLGPNGEDYPKRLPTPTASEGGMSQQRLVWLSGKPPHIRSLYIRTTANGALGVKPLDGVTIDEIRITSPEFWTREGIKCGSSLAQTQFPSFGTGLPLPESSSRQIKIRCCVNAGDPISCEQIDQHPYEVFVPLSLAFPFTHGMPGVPASN